MRSLPMLPAAALSFLLLSSSCSVTRISGESQIPILVNQPATRMSLIQHVAIRQNRNFNYSGHYDLGQLFSKKIGQLNPQAIANARFSSYYGFDNCLINLFTLGLANSHKIFLEGDFLKDYPTASAQ